MKIKTLYGASWCPSCNQAKKFLDKLDIDYTYVDVEKPEGKNEFITQTRSKSIPVFKVGEEQVIGFDSTKYKKLLGL